ncbi:extracellular solute-binding protein [Microbacterium halophytorum]|uniref:extracellular solute-binding protein n=1 Tax=Microbacterium halophytorum TaxID=2067568 RepID=UPI000CFE3166|nr:extracellular solute-binding protein [Microbacterium halophytorum]
MNLRSIRTAAVAAAAAGALALTGCAGGGGEGGGDENSLTFWHNSTTGPGKAYWEEVAAAFEEETGVSVEITSIQNEDMDGKLQTAANSGDMPDVFMARGGGKLADIVDAGVVKDVTDLVTDETKEAIGEAPFSAFTIDGAIYGVPVSVLPEGIFYSQDLFDEAGITENPTTFDELGEAVDKLKSADIQPIALGAKDAWPAAHWYYSFALRACGQDTIENIAANLEFSDGCWQQAAEDLAEFAATEPFNEGFLTTPAQEGAGSSAGLIANHKAAMELMGGWDVGVIADLTPDSEPLPDLSWFPLPATEGGEGDPTAMMGGVDGFSCSQDSPAACEDFLNFFSQTEWQEKYSVAFNAIPVNIEAQSAVTDPSLLPVMEAYNEAGYIVLWLDTLLGQDVGNALNTAVVEMLAGSGTPESFMDTIEQAAARG